MIESPKPYTGIYSMHKYWSKKPFNIINKYIKQYTHCDDVILDPFCGSGISNVESILLGRKTIGIDINPMAVFITQQMLNTGPSEKEITDTFKRLEKFAKGVINDMYAVNRNGKQLTGTHFVYEHGALVEIWYKGNGKGLVKEPPRHDDLSGVKCSIPDDLPLNRQLIPNARINTKEGMSVHDLFTSRNLLALSTLMREINNIKNAKIKNFFKFCFTSCLGQASKMVFVVSRRGKVSGNGRSADRREVGSWVIGYWLPKTHFEINVWKCFERRYRRILAAKKSYYNLNLTISYASNFDDLRNGHNVLLINKSCQAALREIADNSVDYVITDPPHGDRVPYLELSTMWNTWMNFDVNFDDELVVSNARSRQKTVEKYVVMMESIISEIVRVLKPSKYFTLMFNTYSNVLWRSLQEMVFKCGITLVEIDSMGYSANSVVQDSRQGGLKTDFILTFQKTTVSSVSLRKAEHGLVRKIVQDYCSSHDDHTLYKIRNYIIEYMMKRGILFDTSQTLSEIMECVHNDRR